MLLYIDGTLAASTTAPAAPVFDTTEPLRIGSGLLYSLGMEFTVGQIDEVRLWSVARSQSEIQSYRFGSVSAPQPYLVGYWTFNEASGNALDSSGNGNDGIFHGDATRVPCTYP